MFFPKASFRINYDKTFDTLSPINNKIAGSRVKPVKVYLLEKNKNIY